MDEPFDLYSPTIDADPFPAYERLREDHPCYWSEGAKLWILSRYDDIAQAAQDWETFSSSQGNMIDEIPGRAGATLGTTDPPRHDRLRALSTAAFARKNLQHIIEPALAIADASLDRILARGEFDSRGRSAARNQASSVASRRERASRSAGRSLAVNVLSATRASGKTSGSPTIRQVRRAGEPKGR